MTSCLSREWNVWRGNLEVELSSARPHTDKGIIKHNRFAVNQNYFDLLWTSTSCKWRPGVMSRQIYGMKHRLVTSHDTRCASTAFYCIPLFLSSHLSLIFHSSRAPPNTERWRCGLYIIDHLSLILTKPIQWTISSQMLPINHKLWLAGIASVSKTCLLHRKDHQVGDKSANQRFHM